MSNYPSLKTLCHGCNADCCNGTLYDSIHIFSSEKLLVKRLTKLGAKFTLAPNGWTMIVEGGCPFLKDGKCSIYKIRPIACKNFDCREYPKIMNDVHGM